MAHGQKIMKKIAVLFLVGCLLSSGCARIGSEGNEGHAGNKEAEIIMWLTGSEGQAIAINNIARDFYRDTGIKVRCDAISWGDAHSKYLTSIAGGVAPDIGTMGLTWGAEFGELGALVDLNLAYPDELRPIKEAVFQGLWDSIESKGRVFGIPFDMTEYVLYYRTDMIKLPPKTWDELTGLLTEMKKSGKSLLFDWGSMNWIGYSPFMWQAGGDYYNADQTEVTIDSAECVGGMRFFSELYTVYGVPKTRIPLEQGMRTGDFPLAISGNWKIEELHVLAPELTGKWAVSTLPRGPSGRATAFIGGRIMGVFSQSKHREDAWRFVKYLFTPEVQAMLYEDASGKQDTYLPPVRKTIEALKMDDAFKSVLISQALDAKGPPPVSNWDTCARFVDEAIQRVILQGSDPKTELSRAGLELEKLLKK